MAKKQLESVAKATRKLSPVTIANFAKGKRARQTANIAYRVRRVKWEVWLDREMSEELEASIPDGVSRSDYIREIFCKHLTKYVA